jgi:hypothetical protein
VNDFLLLSGFTADFLSHSTTFIASWKNGLNKIWIEKNWIDKKE